MWKISPPLKLAVLVIFIALILLAFLNWVLFPLVNSTDFQFLVERLGFAGYLIIILYTVASHVFAPLSSAPALAVAVAVYGVVGGMVLLYFGSLAGSVVNFYISRFYGRGLVRKLAGKKTIEQVDEFTEVSGKKALWASRLLGFAVFEIVSYAAGLTSIKFKDYFVITNLANAIVYLLTYVIFVSTRVRNDLFILVWVVSVFLAGAVFIWLVRSHVKSRKNSFLGRFMGRIFKR